MATGMWEALATVESDSQPGKTYRIQQRKGAAAGAVLGCDCTAYRFARGDGKTCKHIRAFEAGAAMDAGRAVQQQPRELVSVKSDGETFTVRRAISFGAIAAQATPKVASLTVNTSHVDDVELGIVVHFDRVVTLPVQVDGKNVDVYVGVTRIGAMGQSRARTAASHDEVSRFAARLARALRGDA